jgi:hypothetical protein
MSTKTIPLEVSSSRAEEWLEWIRSIEGTRWNPVPGDRILTAARRILDPESGEQALARRRWKVLQTRKAR